MSTTHLVRDVLHESSLLEPRALLSTALPELEAGWPVVIRKDEGFFMLTPARAVGYPCTRRLSDLPLGPALPVPAELSLLDFLKHPYDQGTGFCPVLDGARPVGVASRLAALELVRGSFSTDEREAASVSALVVRRVTHDLNNLLTVAGLCTAGAKAMLEGETSALQEGETVSECLHRIEAALRRSSQLVQRLGRLRDSRVQLVHLLEVVQESVELMRPLVRAGVWLTVESQLSDDTIECDPLAVERIVENLVLNASEASTRGGEVRIRLMLANTSEVKLTVEDDGIGIPVESLPQITEPFYSTKAGAGRGLGLSIVCEAAKQLGARVSVHSKPGCGTRFHVFLPRRGDRSMA